jgi:hypothetical protein
MAKEEKPKWEMAKWEKAKREYTHRMWVGLGIDLTSLV